MNVTEQPQEASMARVTFEGCSSTTLVQPAAERRDATHHLADKPAWNELTHHIPVYTHICLV